MILVIGVGVHSTCYSAATASVVDWSKSCDSRYICIANVHMLMEAYDSPDFRETVNNADLVTPDGMPLVWLMRLKGVKNQQRVYGPTLMLKLLEVAAHNGVAVGFYGGRCDVLDLLVERMQARFDGLNVVYAYSPPFGEVSPDEDERIVADLNRAGVRILFVGLGCPKQEYWMAEHRGRVNAVMLGVGAAFDFHAGMKPQAPTWMQRVGLEWLFRLFVEPRRLWRRYLYHNPRFLVLAVADLLGFIKS